VADAPKTEVVKTEAPRRVHKLEGGRLAIVIVVVVYVVLFIALNTRRVQVSFVFFTIRSQLLIAFGFIALLSFGAGYFVHSRFGSAQHSLLSRKPQNSP
jgi:uncharacterized integral membrane protein